MGHDEREQSGRRVGELEEQVRRLEGLRQSGAILDAISHCAGTFICAKDRQGRVVMANPAMLELLGRGPEVIGTDDLDGLDDPALAARIRQNDRRIMETGVTETVEETVQTPARRWTVLFTKSPLRDAGGNVTGIVGVGVDITDRKRAEELLAASEHKYRLLHESMTDAYARVDMDGRIQEFNRAYQEMLGYDKEEIYRLTYKDITPEKWHAFEEEVVRTQILPLGHSEVYSKEYRRKDGTEFPVELRTYLLKDEAGRAEGMWAIVRDITERRQAVALIRESRDELEKRVAERTEELTRTVGALREEVAERVRAEEGLRVSEERHRTILRTAMDGFWRADAEGRLLEVNDTYCRMSGYSREELLGMRIADVEAWETPEGMRAHFETITSRGHDRFESRHRRKDGSEFDVEVSVQCRAGEGMWFVAFLRDVTERKRAQAELAESREELRSVLASMDDLLFVLDREGRFVDHYEPAGAGLYAPASEFLGKSYREIMPPEVTALLDGTLEALRRTGQVQLVEYPLDMPGGREWFSVKCSVRRDGRGEVLGSTVVARNVTERVRAQEMLRASEERYRRLFEHSPVALWEMDFSELREHLAELRARGVQDVAGYCREHPEAADAPVGTGRAVSLNEAAVQMYGAASKEDLLANWRPVTAQRRQHMVEARLALAGGQKAFHIQTTANRLDGRVLDVVMDYLVLPGQEETLGRVVAAAMDVTALKESQAALQSAHRKMMYATEGERRRVATELHDSVAQDIVALQLMLGGLCDRLGGQAAAGPLQEAVDRCTRLAREIRGICHGLYPQALELFGLTPTLGQLAEICTRAGLVGELYVDPAVANRRFSSDVEIAVFRIAQEASANAMKHSGAGRLSLDLHAAGGGKTLVLAVTDDGKGFTVDPGTPGGLGLVSMRERAEAVGGMLTIDSTPGGTTVQLLVPMGAG